MKLNKRKRHSRDRGTRTHGWAMKKHKGGKGNQGGKGMAGTGKRADHRKSWVIVNSYPYFGKQGTTSKSTERKKNPVINLEELEVMVTKNKGKTLELKDYKVLGDGEIKIKVTVQAKAFSNSAKKKIEAAGGQALIIGKKKEE